MDDPDEYDEVEEDEEGHPEPEVTIEVSGLSLFTHVGVTEAEREVVFERFSRGSTASHSGSGLGLALVAQQAHLHGGTASLLDSPLGGARLLLRLPAPS